MGAWGTDSFANDDAMDWVWGLAESADLRVVRGALDDVLRTDGYLDAGIGAVGLAAAEVVAALDGRAADDLPAEVTQWVAAHRAQRDPALADLARAAVTRITSESSRSELRELWDEADPDDRDAWRASAEDLRARLG
jgi:hypothetical protein